MDKVKVNRLKDKAELFLKEDIRAVVKTYNKDFYFCDIMVVGETRLMVHSFAGKRKGQSDNLLWIDIFDIDEYDDGKNRVGEEERIVRGDQEY